MTQFWDRLGISTSILCLIHCLATPALILLAPFASPLLAGHWFHILIALIVFPVAFWALWNGYRRHHMLRVLILGAIGLSFVAAALLMQHHHMHNLEFSFMAPAGIFLATAHWLNLKACRRCEPAASRP